MVIRRCVTCKKQRVGPGVQKMGSSPEEIFRVVPLSSFMHIGNDSAGPCT